MRFGIKSVLCAAALLMSASASVQAADMVDNPAYAAWAKFKPGSSSTMSMDIDKGGNKIHIETTSELVSVKDDQVELKVSMKMNIMGHEQTPPSSTQIIKAKTEDLSIKDAGTKDVEAMGKTFSCKVSEVTNSKKAVGRSGPAAAMGGSGTAYTSTDVPGGMVKFEANSGDSKVTMVLTAMESK